MLIPITDVRPGDETASYRVLHVYRINGGTDMSGVDQPDGIRLHVRYLDGGDGLRDFNLDVELEVEHRHGLPCDDGSVHGRWDACHCE